MISFYCLVFHLDNGTIRLTDLHRDYTDSSGNVYSMGYFKLSQSVTQKSSPSANDFTIDLSAVDQTMVSAFASQNYKGRRCEVLQVKLNEDESHKSTRTWLDGELNKYSFSNSDRASLMKITVGSIFSAFESVKMIGLTVKFAKYINEDNTIYWGKEGS